MDAEGDGDRQEQHVEPGYHDHELWAVHALCALRRPADELPRQRRAAVKVAHGADLLDHSEWTTVGGARRNREAVRLSVSEGSVGDA